MSAVESSAEMPTYAKMQIRRESETGCENSVCTRVCAQWESVCGAEMQQSAHKSAEQPDRLLAGWLVRVVCRPPHGWHLLIGICASVRPESRQQMMRLARLSAHTCSPLKAPRNHRQIGNPSAAIFHAACEEIGTCCKPNKMRSALS